MAIETIVVETNPTPIARAACPAWSAIDRDEEQRYDTAFRRKPSLKLMLYRWLFEYNRY